MIGRAFFSESHISPFRSCIVHVVLVVHSASSIPTCATPAAFPFPMSLQDDLCRLWLGAPEGKLCGREQAKAWALREVWRNDGKGDYGMYGFIASKLKKNVGGKPVGASPGSNAMQELFDKIDADPEWYPGKGSDARRGPKRILRGGKVTAIVSAAKRLKAEGNEPTYSAVVAACPFATVNPLSDRHAPREAY